MNQMPWYWCVEKRCCGGKQGMETWNWSENGAIPSGPDWEGRLERRIGHQCNLIERYSSWGRWEIGSHKSPSGPKPYHCTQYSGDLSHFIPCVMILDRDYSNVEAPDHSVRADLDAVVDRGGPKGTWSDAVSLSRYGAPIFGTREETALLGQISSIWVPILTATVVSFMELALHDSSAMEANLCVPSSRWTCYTMWEQKGINLKAFLFRWYVFVEYFLILFSFRRYENYHFPTSG